MVSLYPETSSSVRLTWRLVQPHQYIEGYFVNYREMGKPRAVFRSGYKYFLRIYKYFSSAFEQISNDNIFSMFTNVLQILVTQQILFVKYNKYFSNVCQYLLYIFLFTNIFSNVYKYYH